MNKIERVLTDKNLIMFAPEYYYDNTNEYLYITCGPANERVYEQKDWGYRKEAWYTHGNNHFRCYIKNLNGKWDIYSDNVIDTSEFDDVMKLSVVNAEGNQLMWFSGLKDGHWDIYVTASNSRLIEKIELSEVSDGEIHRYLPCVIYDGIYKMWYASRNEAHRRIFYAESIDGKKWTGNHMVLDIGAVGEGDHYASDCPDVAKCNGEYIMFYGGGTSRGIHLAVSRDGLCWKRKGAIIPRGAENEDSYHYSFYPALAWNGQNIEKSDELLLFYAGEDINNNWRILSVRGRFLEDIYTPIIMNNKLGQDIRELLRKVPKEYFYPQEDCNNKDYYYENEKIVQLRPSTGPVFLVKEQNMVVKVMTDRVKAENEYKARLALHDKLKVVDASLLYLEDKVLLIMPYINNSCSCNELFVKEREKFASLYVKMLTESFNVIRINANDCCVRTVNYTGQTPDILLAWCDLIEKKYKDIVLVSGISNKSFKIEKEMKKAKKLITMKPQQCSLFSGDFNLHNVLCVGNELKYLDFEYWGYFDVDYIVAKIIGSLFKHCDILSTDSYKIRGNEIYIEYNTDTYLQPLVSSGLYKEKLKGISVNFDRIKAYILSKLYFRFMKAFDYLYREEINELTREKNMKEAIRELTRVIGVLDLFAEDEIW